jgi:hypothetical protein
MMVGTMMVRPPSGSRCLTSSNKFMLLANQIQQARHAGYSDSEILQCIFSVRADLAEGIRAALRGGYGPSQVLGYLSGTDGGGGIGEASASAQEGATPADLDRLDSVARAEMEKAERAAWLKKWRKVQRGWARWVRWWRQAPAEAEEYKRQREDGNVEWLLELAERRTPLGKQSAKRGV